MSVRLPHDPDSPILEYGEIDPNNPYFMRITPDRLLDALVDLLFPAIAEGRSPLHDCATLIEGWPCMLVDTDDPAWDAYRPAPPEEPPEESEPDEPPDEGDEI